MAEPSVAHQIRDLIKLRASLIFSIFVLVSSANTYLFLVRPRPTSIIETRIDVGSQFSLAKMQIVPLLPPEAVVARLKPQLLTSSSTKGWIDGYSYEFEEFPPSVKIRITTPNPIEVKKLCENIAGAQVEKLTELYSSIANRLKLRKEYLLAERSYLNGRLRISSTKAPLTESEVEAALRLQENDLKLQETELLENPQYLSPPNSLVIETQKPLAKIRSVFLIAAICLVSGIISLLAASILEIGALRK